MHPFVLATLTTSMMYFILALIYATNASTSNRGLAVAVANTGVALMAPLLNLTMLIAIVFGFAAEPFVGTEIAAIFIVITALQVAIAAVYLLIVASPSIQQEVPQS